MKKFLILMILFVTALSINAQINRNIWGLTLGKSTKQQVISVLKSKGLKYESSRDKIATDTEIITVNSTSLISFGGAFWNKIEIYTVDNILFDFRFIRYNQATYDAHKAFNSLKYKLNQKYAAYKDDLGIMATYDDKKTCIYITICDSPNVGTFYLLNYKYNGILDIQNTEGIDDL